MKTKTPFVDLDKAAGLFGGSLIRASYSSFSRISGPDPGRGLGSSFDRPSRSSIFGGPRYNSYFDFNRGFGIPRRDPYPFLDLNPIFDECWPNGIFSCSSYSSQPSRRHSSGGGGGGGGGGNAAAAAAAAWRRQQEREKALRARLEREEAEKALREQQERDELARLRRERIDRESQELKDLKDKLQILHGENPLNQAELTSTLQELQALLDGRKKRLDAGELESELRAQLEEYYPAGEDLENRSHTHKKDSHGF